MIRSSRFVERGASLVLTYIRHITLKVSMHLRNPFGSLRPTLKQNFSHWVGETKLQSGNHSRVCSPSLYLWSWCLLSSQPVIFIRGQNGFFSEDWMIHKTSMTQLLLVWAGSPGRTNPPCIWLCLMINRELCKACLVTMLLPSNVLQYVGCWKWDSPFQGW